ncbi:DNA mismatch repair endonuclease MutL [Acidipila sp. EB88]|uniref:DNA mismatch repair endonuclease MutL n=1 Tax=Acidipila sp. EB88 TaxID=2305226 RepID=UPI000F5F097C|nr:DNA mismatch repair endonuclease MutL [Acidipila sp. EB88]RRA48691.1 DNA mismatch repair endonuclease MutL [Acidipila sp. EB88]
MGRIRILSDQVANQIAAGEVVDRPASVVKELLENAIDAGATRIRIEIEGGGRKLIRMTDNGHGMGSDDAMLAFERHATSKLRTSDDLLQIATLGFRGEALASIASISRLELLTRADDEPSGTRIEIVGGKLTRVEDAGGPAGTTFTIQDLFFNTPARRKFLKSEQTETSHVTALVTHYALAHPDRHFELLSSTHTLLNAPPVAKPEERIYQIFGRDTLDQLLPMAAERPFDHGGLPEPPPWKRDEHYEPPTPGHLRLSGFTAKPELQKLNRNSIYVFVNQRLIRDRLILHAISEAYRNVMPPTSYPVMLLFLEMPPAEVDVNVHPAKTEVRFRQPSLIHDFVRDSIRYTLMKARPAASFLSALGASPTASQALMPGQSEHEHLTEITPPSEYLDSEPPSAQAEAGSAGARSFSAGAEPFTLAAPILPAEAVHLPFAAAAAALSAFAAGAVGHTGPNGQPVLPQQAEAEPQENLNALASLKPLGQLRESFILATNDEGLWIIDQHVAHERVLFEKILRERAVEKVQRQRLLMPLLIDLQPHQMVLFAGIARELERNGFEAEPFGPRTIAIKAAPIGLEGRSLERMVAEVLEQAEHEQTENLEAARTRIAASIACHAAIKVNMPLDPERMRWLLSELGKTEHPTSCPHGRPIALRYSWKDIQRAFQRI